MKNLLIVCVLLSGAASVFGHSPRHSVSGQDGTGRQPSDGPPVAKKSFIGEVLSIDQPAGQLSLKPDQGEIVMIYFDDKTACLRLSPGETSLQNAVRISSSEVSKGDRVYVRSGPVGDRDPIRAQQLIVMSRADLEQKQAQDRQQWLQRGIAGVVTQVDAEKNEILIQVRDGATSKPLLLGATGDVRYRRYAPDSVRFAEARPSSIKELKPGDQLRALGQKRPDGTGFIPEEIVSGSFQTVGATVTSVNAGTGEVVMTVLGGRQSITVSVKKDATLRRITPQVAASIVQQRNQSRPQPASQPQAQTARAGGGPGDLQELFDKMPALTLAEVRAGDVVAVYSTKGADPARITAIFMITGVNNLLNLLQPRSPGPANTPSPTTGLPSGILDFLIGLP